jgi:hypothetical protein
VARGARIHGGRTLGALRRSGSAILVRMEIRLYRSADEATVVALWKECELTRPWNDPHMKATAAG